VRDRAVAEFGPDDPTTLTMLVNLAAAYQSAGRLPEAIRLYERVRDKAITTPGPDHPTTLITLQNLATAYVSARRLPEAVRLLEQVRDKLVATGRGPDHPLTLAALHNLAHAYRAAGRPADAIPLFEQVRDAQERTRGPNHLTTLLTLNNLAATCWSVGRLERSVPLFEEALRREIQAVGKDHYETIRTAFNLGVNYHDAGRLDDAVRVFDDWLPRAAKVLPVGHDVRDFGRSAGAETYAGAGRHDRAEPLLREAADLVKLRAGADAPAYAGQLAMLGLNLLHQRKWADAEPVLRECLAIRDKKQAGTWTTFNTRSMLGGALLGRKKYAEAEPLLLEGYEGMKQRAAKIPEPHRKARLSEALERLVRLYDAWGKPAEAAKWRKELETSRQAERKTDRAKDR
jgi:tetratricopeptide (TPR) repeat protein